MSGTISINSVRAAAAALFAFTAFATKAAAQDAVAYHSNGFELRPYVGAYIPTGDQRDLLKDAVLVGGQASYRINPNFALTGTLGWSPSEVPPSVSRCRLSTATISLSSTSRRASVVPMKPAPPVTTIFTIVAPPAGRENIRWS